MSISMRVGCAAMLIAIAPFAGARAQAPHVSPDPDSARIITADIRLFWDALDRAPAESLAMYLQRDYLDRASVGVQDFIPGRILSATSLAAVVTSRRARYDSARAATFQIDSAVPGIRAAFHRLKEIYPEAVFPDVYFVIGRLNSGGTSTRNGLLIGAEMYRSPAGLPAIVAHELIHFQQHGFSVTLLQRAFGEGSADFIGEMIAGAQINNEAQRYGRAREHELWQEFRNRLADLSTTGWLYGKPPGERPADLGYFIGYRIAEAYYNRATDKRQAIHEIINAQNVLQLLEQSGYDP